MAETSGAQDSGGTGGSPCPETIRRALAAHTTMTLAYADEDGPGACAVLYATDPERGGRRAGRAAPGPRCISSPRPRRGTAGRWRRPAPVPLSRRSGTARSGAD
ncbi:hypothetical protein O1L68_17630 [Streptomyces lydicus]|nr:hypothetical protein [Streptomyces lydicus]